MSHKGSESETPAVVLRRRATEMVREKACRIPENIGNCGDTLPQGVPTIAQMLHELRVHQIELEMQNEELRRIQVELEASRARYFDLYDLAPVGYCTLSEAGLILEANLTAAALLGAARGALVRQPLPLFILPEDQDIYYRHRKLLFETGAPQICELRLVKKDAAPFWVRIDTIAAQDADGAPVCRAMMIDINDRKRAQDELRRLNEGLEQRVMDRTAQLEAAYKELAAFSYSVSHDLRAPLRAIDGFSNILMKEHTDRLDAEGVRLLNVIRTNAKQMDQLISDMLSLSRVSKSDLQHAGIDMAAMAHSIYQEIAPPEVRRKFSFSVAPLPDGDGDPVLLRHVWSNLLANAVKFTLPRDDRRIDISGHKEKGMNIYSVRDTGVGFNPNYAHKLFGVFQRLHKSSEFEGNGVGLAIVRRIVERHGGRVWAEGKINEGAAFFFSLPIKEVKDEPHE